MGRVGFLTGSGGGFDLDLWLTRIGSGAFLVAAASAAVILVTLAVRATERLGG